MLHIVPEENLHRTVARLYGAYDVVVVDLPLVAAPDGRWNFQPFEPTLRNLVNGVANYGGFNQVEPMLVEGRLPKDDHENALHVVTGLHETPEDDRLSVLGMICRYSRIKSHPGQRLLVLTDSVTRLDSPQPWAHQRDIAIVHVQGQ